MRSASLPPFLHARRGQRLDVFGHGFARRLPQRLRQALVAALDGGGHALRAVHVDVPAVDAVLDQLGGELLAGIRVKPMNQPLELLEIRIALQAEHARLPCRPTRA